MEKVIDITAKRDGFYRAGMPHSDKTRTYPLTHFSSAQLKQLQDEPMLVVAIRDKNEAGAKDVVAELRQTVTQLEENVRVLNSQLELSSLGASQLSSELDAERLKVTGLTGELDSERQMVIQVNSDLEAERQKVADLTAKLATAEKAANKGK